MSEENVSFTSSAQSLGPEGQPKPTWPCDEKQYNILYVVGQGATSKVYAAECIPQYNRKCAIKVINLENCNSSAGLKEINREIASMKRLRHENIVAYYTSFLSETKLHIVMDLCEHGSLLEKIKAVQASRSIDHGVFDEATIATILRDVLRGLAYIHDNDLVHRDLKCGNLLVRSDGCIKVADFGVSAFLHTLPLSEGSLGAGGSVSSGSLGTRHTFVGTPCWVAPEVMNQLHNSHPELSPYLDNASMHCEHCIMNRRSSLNNEAPRERKLSLIQAPPVLPPQHQRRLSQALMAPQPHPGKRRHSQCTYENAPDFLEHCRRASVACECKVAGYNCLADIWSLGITTLELATGHAPYAKFAPFKVLMMTLQNDPPTLETCATTPHQYDNYGQRFRKFLRSCLVKEPSQRATAKDLLHHPYIKGKSKDREFLCRVLLGSQVPQPQAFKSPPTKESEGAGAVEAAQSDWCFPSDSSVDEALARAAANLTVVNTSQQISPEGGVAQGIINNNLVLPSIETPGTNNSNTVASPRPQSLPVGFASGDAGQTVVDKSKPPIMYKITLMKRNPMAKNELQNISFCFDASHDSPIGLANDLVENDLLERSNLVLVAHHIDLLVANPNLKDTCFPLYTQPPSGVPINEQEMQGFAKLTICVWDPERDKDLL